MKKSLRVLAHAERRYAKALFRAYHVSRTSPISIGAKETRDELLVRATRQLQLVRSLKNGPHARSKYEARIALSKVAILRTEAMKRARIDAAGKAFYCTIRSGARHGLLYGPFATQREALRALPMVRTTARDLNPIDSSFAEFGTCSIDAAKARPGKLNEHLPALDPLPEICVPGENQTLAA